MRRKQWIAVATLMVAGMLAGCEGGGTMAPAASAPAAAASAPAAAAPGIFKEIPVPEPGRTAAEVYDIASLPVEKAVLGYAPEVAPEITRRTPAKVVVDLEVSERVGRMADGTEYLYWTFGGSVPGPMVRVREGDMVEFTLMNHPDSRLPHNIDLHGVIGQGGGAEATFVAPGEKKTFTFRALQPGAYIYHCATAPVGMHIANGMYGLIVVDPKEGWPKVDKEFYVVQSEFYTEGDFGEPGLQPFSLERALREDPGYVVFNGSVGSLVGDNAMQAKVGETVRIYFGNGGPNLVSSFHVIGEIFDTVYLEGGSRTNHNVQTTLVPAGGSAIVDFKLRVPATYILVDHSIFRAFNKGAIGMLKVTGEKDPNLFASSHEAQVYVPSPGAHWGKPVQPKAAEPAPGEWKETRKDEERLNAGFMVYKTNCASCHGEKGDGVPNVFPALTQSTVLFDTPAVVKSVVQGRKGNIGIMPGFPHLKDVEIADLISYTQTNLGKKPTMHDVNEIGRIRAATK